ncbi:uncharacterized protein [Engystomops pustulosus]|uniref:uncharacterized protein n=1 Tax=Engystomops pustulosus TaxID=76066 RepID=UPI003AFAB766
MICSYERSIYFYFYINTLLFCFWSHLVLVYMTSTEKSHVLKLMAELSLHTAISSERAKQWVKAIEHYKKLLKILNAIKSLGKGEIDPSYKQLLYETHYHLGIAYQNVNCHEDAVLQYTKALQASSISKKNCAVGCTSATCLHTPVLTRRAFAYVKCDEASKALRDADTAIYLDRSNPDVYCIRALVWSTLQKEEEAIKDLNYGLRINPHHACTLILRGNIKKYMRSENHSDLQLNNDQEQALQSNHYSIRFLGVKDFNNSEISEFCNTLLWSLNVPHTVISVRLLSACSTAQGVSNHLKRAFSAPVPRKQNEYSFNKDQQMASFHGGATIRNSKTIGLERRLNYGRAVTASSAGLKGSRRYALENIVPVCDSSNVCPRVLLQKRGENHGIFEIAGFPVCEMSHSGILARMYNKPWLRDKLPVQENAKRRKEISATLGK